MRAALTFDACGHLISHRVRGGIFFPRISKHANPIKLFRANEVQQPPKGGLVFAREADDERCPQSYAGYAAADPFEQAVQRSARTLTAHRAQDVVVGMLQRHVYILNHSVKARYGVEQLVGYIVWIAVKQPDPTQALKRVQIVQQGG